MPSAIHAPLTGLFFITPPHSKDRPGAVESFLFRQAERKRGSREAGTSAKTTGVPRPVYPFDQRVYVRERGGEMAGKATL